MIIVVTTKTDVDDFWIPLDLIFWNHRSSRHVRHKSGEVGSTIWVDSSDCFVSFLLVVSLLRYID